MGRPLARVGDAHTCPQTTGPNPHTGGPIVGPGSSTVLAENMLVALENDQATCNGPPDMLTSGSSTVLVENRGVVRMGDTTAHGGVVTGGASYVLVEGSGSPPQVERLQESAGANRPFCEICEDCE